MSGAAGLGLACGWVYSGMEIRSGPRKQHLMAIGWGSACSWRCSSARQGGTASVEGMMSPFLFYVLFLTLLHWVFSQVHFKTSQKLERKKVTTEFSSKIFWKYAKWVNFPEFFYSLQGGKKSHWYIWICNENRHSGPWRFAAICF